AERAHEERHGEDREDREQGGGAVLLGEEHLRHGGGQVRVNGPVEPVDEDAHRSGEHTPPQVVPVYLLRDLTGHVPSWDLVLPRPEPGGRRGLRYCGTFL